MIKNVENTKKNNIKEDKESKSSSSESSSSNHSKKTISNKIFFKKYRCIKKLGEGSFGMIYKAEYNDEYFALKFENATKGNNLLESEAAIMSYLKGPNIPFVKSFGFSGEYHILVMQLLGKSLEDIFSIKKKFSLKTICLLAFQMISVLEYIHNKHIIHRDIKPDNFVMGLDDLSQFCYLLDFGLAKKYRSSNTLKQYPFVNHKKLTGTARYASINALQGYEQSRRDDLESVGYVLMYLLRGNLPWQGMNGKTKDERYKKILQKKIETSSADLCAGFPNELQTFIEYTRNLEYTEQPDYDMLRKLFDSIMKKEKFKYDYIYDWTTREEIRMRNALTLKTDVESHNFMKRKQQEEEMDNKVTLFTTNVNNNDKKNKGDNIYNTENKKINDKAEAQCCTGCIMF
jgi:serine/threonine protein kinase